ncbi:hypothetical protein BN2364_2584 [Alloalcanivorax xenomutans]|nr:hypothetical protein BN2364_2584 [Alloalcanivorax xenomutans]
MGQGVRVMASRRRQTLSLIMMMLLWFRPLLGLDDGARP